MRRGSGLEELRRPPAMLRRALLFSSIVARWRVAAARRSARLVRAPPGVAGITRAPGAAIGQPRVNIAVRIAQSPFRCGGAARAKCEWSRCHHRPATDLTTPRTRLGMTSGTDLLRALALRDHADRVQQRASCSGLPRTARWTRECPAPVCHHRLTRAIAEQNGPRRCSISCIAWMR